MYHRLHCTLLLLAVRRPIARVTVNLNFLVAKPKRPTNEKTLNSKFALRNTQIVIFVGIIFPCHTLKCL
jgi:hypothetical protein